MTARAGVKGINPASAMTVGATAVTITATNLTGATAVTIGGMAATGIVVVNATTITAVTLSMPRARSTTTAGGTPTVTNGFTHVAAPVVKGSNPPSAMTVHGGPG
jgi:hypothetical protein